MLSYALGAASYAGGRAMAAYYGQETLTPEVKEERVLAAYYGAEEAPRTQIDELGLAVHRGEVPFDEALQTLIQAAERDRPQQAPAPLASLPPAATDLEHLAREVARGFVDFDDAMEALVDAEMGRDLDGGFMEIERRVGNQFLDAITAAEHEMMGTTSYAQLSARLADAVTRADFAENEVGNRTIGVLRPDLSPALARRLGIDTERPLTEHATANLMAGLTAGGGEIAGKHYRAATLSLDEIYGVSEKALPTLTQLDHMLAGRKADGSPLVEQPKHKVTDAERRLRAAVGLPRDGEPTAAQRAHLAAGRLATGQHVDRKAYQRAIANSYKPVGFADFTFSASKSLSTAFAMEPSEEGRAAILSVHTRSVEATMRVMAGPEGLGWARKGDGGGEGEPAEIAWQLFQHFTTRPTDTIVRWDAEGNPYSHKLEVPTLRADPSIHTHGIVFNHAMVPGTGRLASIDFDRLKGDIHVYGGIYRAYSAKYARELGIAVHEGEHGDAQFSAVSKKTQELFSKRGLDARTAAKDFAREHGLDWDVLKPEQKIALMRDGTAKTREAKQKDLMPDTVAWRQEAADAGLTYQPVLYQQVIKPELTAERRHEVGYEKAHPKVGELLKGESVVIDNKVQAIAAHSLITAGISDRPMDDIKAIVGLMDRRGISQSGEVATLVWDYVTQRGKRHAVVSSDRNITTENELVDIARMAARDMSSALTPKAIDRAAEVYLSRHPEIDPRDGHWKSQLEWAHKLGEGGRLSVAYGAAGAGKTTAASLLAEAWKTDGRKVYGAASWWTATDEITSVAEKDRASLTTIIKRAKEGRITLDEKSVLVVDEVGTLGNREMRDLLHLSKTAGVALCMMGGPEQIRGAESGDPLSLIEKVLPNAVPELVKSVRQKTLHEREVADLFRTDPAAGLAMKLADGSARLVAGGPDVTIAEGVRERRAMLAANAHDPNYSLAVMAVTNAEVATISRAIREDRKAHGEIGPDLVTVNAVDRTGRHTLPLGVGDEVRLYRSVRDGGGGKELARNGHVLTVRAVDAEGMNVLNQKTGREGRVPWSKLQAHRGTPVEISYGSCTTIDAKQASTVSQALLIASEGSAKLRANKAYVAATRHRDGVTLLLDESSVRQSISKRAMIGEFVPIHRDDILRRVAEDISRAQVKSNATEVFSAPAQPRRTPDREGRGLRSYARTRVLEAAHVAREHLVLAVEHVRSWRREPGRGISR